MEEETVKQLLDVFDKTCGLCQQSYDLRQHTPMMLCLSQHICCQSCINKRIDTQRENLECPFCHTKIKSNEIFKVRRFDKIIELHEKYELQAKIREEQKYEAFKAHLKANPDQNNNRRWYQELEEKQGHIAMLYDFMLAQATDFFRQKKIPSALSILQHLLFEHNNKNSKFMGLGSRWELEGYGCDTQRWVQDHIGKEIISPLDLLALCYLSAPNTPAQKDTLIKLSMRFPDDYRVQYGLALVEYNNSSYTAAEQLFQKVVAMKEDFNKPFEILAHIQLRIKNNSEKATKIAKEALTRFPKSIFAKFIMAMALPNEAFKQRKALLEEVIKDDRFFMQARLELGEIYWHNMGQSELAEKQFRACLSINQDYLPARLHLAECCLSSGKPKEAAFILNDYKTAKQSYEYCALLGRAYRESSDFKNAIYWFEKCGGQNEILGELFLEEGMYEKALLKFQTISCSSTAQELPILLKMGQCCLMLKRNTDAIKYGQHALIIDPKSEKAQQLIAEANRMLKPAPQKPAQASMADPKRAKSAVRREVNKNNDKARPSLPKKK